MKDLHLANVLQRKPVCWQALLLILVAIRVPTAQAQTESHQAEFFESRIRPVLVEHCYECHNSVDLAEAGVALDWRGGMRAESEHGRVVVPGDAANSLLLKVLRHEIAGLEMPDGSPALAPQVIRDFEAWIEDGAWDPRVRPPTSEELAAATSWDSKLRERRQWWCFQPIRDPPVPAATPWSRHPVDCFVFRAASRAGLAPSAAADKATLMRRLALVLTGIPPTREEIAQFCQNDDPQAFDNLVDQYLDSPRFGERWARHWMDLVRYADSHGSEGDPAIPFAWRYRDYLIRALNADVPWDQLIREHLAGDLLAEPRVNRQLGINESAIGPAHLRMVFHGFAPTDALDEKIRFTDDQINVVSKAFQALTISCARCHHHKFDAISQPDYYAMFGVFGSCRPAIRDVNLPEQQSLHRSQLQSIKRRLKALLAERWISDLSTVESRLNRSADKAAETAPAEASPSALTLWRSIQQRLSEGAGLENALQEWQQPWEQARQESDRDRQLEHVWQWDLSQQKDFQTWFALGNGLSQGPTAAGDFSIHASGDRIASGIFPSAVLTHLLSDRHRGVLGSPRIRLEDEYQVWLQVIGGGRASVRYVVRNYPRDGTVYPIHELNREDWYWHRLDMSYWRGDDVHLELATANDAPVKTGDRDRSWFGIRRVTIRHKDQPPPPHYRMESLTPLLTAMAQSPPSSLDELATRIRESLRVAIMDWKQNEASDATALFLNACLRDGLLDNSLPGDGPLAVQVGRYRQLESEIPLPTRVPGVAEADAFDQPLLDRGNHRVPLDPVPRGYLQVLDGQPFETRQSGRLELAEALLAESNPLTARVMVNRIWQHLFGRGLVSTPDNFGKLGDTPSHPELLDYLARRLQSEGWSARQMIRFLLTSKTWQQSSMPSAEARESDPDNRWLSHANLRRMDAETLRDSLLAVSGQLDPAMYGPGVPANSTSRRRSVYVQSRRNSLDAFLQTFDAPIPFSTTGHRSQTNTPAQALTLMNDPLLLDLANALGERIANDSRWQSDEQRMRQLFGQVLGRAPAASELTWLQDFREQVDQQRRQRQMNRQAWQQQLQEVRQRVAALEDPVRRALLEPGDTSETPQPDAHPLARWVFADSREDAAGNLPVTLHGDAVITADGLQVSGAGFATTGPLPWTLREKTLEAWVQLSDTNQRGGGVVTVQDVPGDVFDAVVFGEQQPGHWMAGSEFFHRTRSFEGAPETTAVHEPVHVAVVYQADGTIRGYRNGQPYGTACRKGNLVTFREQQSQLRFGIRHGNSVTAGRMLRGTIAEVRIYGQALSGEQVAVSASHRGFLTRQEVRQALSNEERRRLEELEQRQGELQARLSELGEPLPDHAAWARLAHALFNLKEFIYIR
jgi:hypothetical protein